jgi:hypothetical protein
MIIGSNFNLGGEINYFLDNSQIDPKEKDIETSSEEQVKAFEEFSSFLKTDPSFNIDINDGSYEQTKDALAFMIEATKQLYKDNWKAELGSIKTRIEQIRNHSSPEESFRETTWLLNSLISNLYEKSIVVNSLMAKKENAKSKEDFFMRTFKNIKNLENLSNIIIKIYKKPVSIGGIHHSFLPHWYQKKYIEVEKDKIMKREA